MKLTRWVALPLLAVLGAAACDGSAERADEASPADGTDEAPATQAASVQQMVHVMNRMPHVMVVSVVEDGEERELGPVPPEETEMFMIEGESGEDVELVARDEADSHSVDFSLVVGEDSPTWTLGGG